MEPLHGYHVTCDGRAEKAEWTIETLSAWLDEVLVLSGMTVIIGPYAQNHAGTLMATAVIAESHITVHAKPESGQVYAEMFSCKPFDLATFIAATVRHFGIAESGTARWFPRGEA